MIRSKLSLVAFVLVASGLVSACGTDAAPDEDVDSAEEAVTCAAKLTYYPVRAKHNNGYDKTAGNASLWTCDDANSNSDFVAGDHLGNDIWAAEGAPVVATVDGTLRLVGFSSYSGNKVTIVDKCGYYHFYAHLQKLGPGISSASNGAKVVAGQVIGYVGKTGTASNGVVHLHYSIYPDGNYDRGINPGALLKAVEKNVCNLPLADVAPAGNLDAAACTKDGIVGWAADKDLKEAPVDVALGFDGKPATLIVKADKKRDDLTKQLGSPNHGFVATLPAELADGKKHEISAFAVDAKNKKQVKLANAPREITCAKPGEPEKPPVAEKDPEVGPNEAQPHTPSPAGDAPAAEEAADEGGGCAASPRTSLYGTWALAALVTAFVAQRRRR